MFGLTESTILFPMTTMIMVNEAMRHFKHLIVVLCELCVIPYSVGNMECMEYVGPTPYYFSHIICKYVVTVTYLSLFLAANVPGGRVPPPQLAAGLNPLLRIGRHRNFWHFDGSRFASWLPSFSVEVMHSAHGAQAMGV